MPKYDTIFALSTVYGRSGVAVFRISGSDSLNALEYFHSNLHNAEPRKAYLVNLFYPSSQNDEHDKQLLDQSLAIFFKAPNSFTGENLLEIHTHGSPAVIKLLTKYLNKIFRLADPGEFSRRAFHNRKLDLTQAEGIADLIEAETEAQARQASQQIQGKLKNLYDSWRNEILTSLSNMESFIDFPDEDIPSDIVDKITEQISNLKLSIRAHLEDKRGEIIRNGIFHSDTRRT